MKRIAFLLAALSVLFCGVALSQTMESAEIETRARVVGKSLRCVVCQNQSIEESNAPLAADMRTVVRERIRAGESNAQVIEYMRARYGDFVLLKPPLQINTYLLWFGPFAALLALLMWYSRRARRSNTLQEATPLTADEQSRYDALTSAKDKT